MANKVVTVLDPADALWREYKKLKAEQRRKLAERILRDDAKLMEDVVDYMLIEKAKREKGKGITWEEYKARQKDAR